MRRILFRVKVEGESCWPELIPGNSYFATKLFKPREGQFLVFKNPKNQAEIFVKKIISIKKGSYFVSGTVSWTVNSDYFGWVGKNLVLGCLICASK